MRKVIDEATNYLCKDTLGLDLEFGKSLGKGFYGASIPVYKGKSEYQFYLFFILYINFSFSFMPKFSTSPKNSGVPSL